MEGAAGQPSQQSRAGSPAKSGTGKVRAGVRYQETEVDTSVTLVLRGITMI